MIINKISRVKRILISGSLTIFFPALPEAPMISMSGRVRAPRTECSAVTGIVVLEMIMKTKKNPVNENSTGSFATTVPDSVHWKPGFHSRLDSYLRISLKKRDSV